MPRLRTVFAVVIVLSMPLSLLAQRVPKRIFVSAVDDKGDAVVDLRPADFQIIENGRPREVTRATLGDVPMRMVLLVDSSTATSPMLASFRTALNNFVDLLPPEHEVAFITSGGQIRVRTQPSTDRVKLKAEIARFASEGGANAFLETLLESDDRFLKKTAPGQWPVFVIVTSDTDTQREPDVVRYNTFMQDFLGRGGTAHVVLFTGKRFGAISDIAKNLSANTGGMYMPLAADSALPDKLRSIAQRVVDDHHQMSERYEIEFSSEVTKQPATVEVRTTREGVRVEMSPRRPF